MKNNISEDKGKGQTGEIGRASDEHLWSHVFINMIDKLNSQ